MYATNKRPLWIITTFSNLAALFCWLLFVSVLTSSGSLRPAKMLPFSLGFCLLGLFSRGEVSRGGSGGGGGGATLSLVGENVSSNQSPKMGSLSSSRRKKFRKKYLCEVLWFKNDTGVMGHGSQNHQEAQSTKLQTGSWHLQHCADTRQTLQ